MLNMVSGGFKNFTSAKQFRAFIGIGPCLNESAASIQGYKEMSRIGEKNRRATRYICSKAAKVYNKGCRELLARMLTGKAKEVT